MLKNISIIFILIISLDNNLFSQGYDWRFNVSQIKGGAKSVIRKSKGDRFQGNQYIWTINEEYNNNGQIVRQENRFLKELRSIYLFGYDSKSNDSIFIEEYSINNPNKKLINRVDLSFNEKHQLIKYISKEDSDSSRIICSNFVYDLINRLKSYTYLFEHLSNNTIWRYRFIYDNTNRIKTKVTIDSQNIISSIIHYRYDRNGNIKSSNSTSYYLMNREKYEDESFEEFINNKGLENRYIIKDIDQKWHYCYDKYGNWTKKFKKYGLIYKLDEKRKIKY